MDDTTKFAELLNYIRKNVKSIEWISIEKFDDWKFLIEYKEKFYLIENNGLKWEILFSDNCKYVEITKDNITITFNERLISENFWGAKTYSTDVLDFYKELIKLHKEAKRHINENNFNILFKK